MLGFDRFLYNFLKNFIYVIDINEFFQYYNIHVRQNNGSLAQLVEHRTVNPSVAGSSPAGAAKILSKTERIFFIHFRFSDDDSDNSASLFYSPIVSTTTRSQFIISAQASLYVSILSAGR